MIEVVGAQSLIGEEVLAGNVFRKEDLTDFAETNRIAETLVFLEFLQFLEL